MSNIFVEINEPFEQLIAVPRLDKEGKPIPYPHGIGDDDDWDKLISKLDEDYKPGATLVRRSDQDYNDPHTWMLLVRVEPKHTSDENYWMPLVYRDLKGKLYYAHPSEFFVINSAPYTGSDYRIKRQKQDATWITTGS